MKRSRKRLRAPFATAGIACAVALAMQASSAYAYCPSYTPAGTATGVRCGVEPTLGTNPTPAAWNGIFAKVSGGKASWGADGPAISKIDSGCLKPKPVALVDAHFPCHVLKALAMVESGWVQFCVPDAPETSVGAGERTIVSFDCGYGVSQVTSGMHVGETTVFDPARVASDATYNLATGTLILRDKWAATSCVGDSNPDVVEDWYTALWAYNGLAYSNNPNNPNLKANRGPYNPKNGGAYAYQERIYGWMENPPSAAHWPALAAAYPNRGAIGDGTRPPALDEPSCASPTSCATTRATHASACDAVTTNPSTDGGAPFVTGPITDPSFPIASATPPPRARDAGLGTPRPSFAPADSGGCGCTVVGLSTPGSRGETWAVLTAFAAFAAIASSRRPRARSRARARLRSLVSAERAARRSARR